MLVLYANTIMDHDGEVMNYAGEVMKYDGQVAQRHRKETTRASSRNHPYHKPEHRGLDERTAHEKREMRRQMTHEQLDKMTKNTGEREMLEVVGQVPQWRPIEVPNVWCHDQLVPKDKATKASQVYREYVALEKRERVALEESEQHYQGVSFFRRRPQPSAEKLELQKQLSDLAKGFVNDYMKFPGLAPSIDIDYTTFNSRSDFLPFHYHEDEVSVIVFLDEKIGFDSDTQVCSHETCDQMHGYLRGRGPIKYEYVHDNNTYPIDFHNEAGGNEKNFALTNKQSIHSLKTCEGTNPGRAIYFDPKVFHGCHVWLGKRNEGDLALRMITSWQTSPQAI